MRILIVLSVFVFTICQNLFSQTKSSDSITIEEEKTNNIIVYGSDTCHYCIDAKSFLKEKNIVYVYYDVDVNLEKQNEMVIKLQEAGIPLDAISLPIIDVHGKLIMNNVADFDGFLKKVVEKTK